MRRELTGWSLIALGISNTIGAGIFVMTGTAAAHYAGPGVAVSYVIGGLACLCAGLCYAELAAMSPDAGSAYTYAYSTLGATVGWIIGWDLIVEFLIAGATVAVGWSGFFCGMLARWHIHLPPGLAQAPFELSPGHQLRLSGAWINLPAVVLVTAQACLLGIGIRESRFVFNLIVCLLVGLIVVIIVAGFLHVDPANWHPFIPPNAGRGGLFGWSGVMAAAALVFFSYVGFETISTATRETRDPGRNLPVGLLGSLGICAALYVLMALVMTGLVSYRELGGPEPIITALQAGGPQLARLAPLVGIGIVAALSAASMGSMYGQIRVCFAMANDGLLPPLFAAVHPRFKVPHWGTLIVGAACAAIAGLFPLEVLGELVSIGTLLAFAIVCLCVLLLRIRQPSRTRPFRVRGIFVVAPLGITVCSYMMLSLPRDTWWRLVAWMAIGLVVYWRCRGRWQGQDRRSSNLDSTGAALAAGIRSRTDP